MQRLGRAAAQALHAVGGMKAATDITGFGLLGHSLEMAKATGCKFVFELHQIPLLEGVMDYAADFVFPGGATNNRMFFEKDVTFAAGVSEAQRMILWDPQTSGGLLIAVPGERWPALEQACQERAQAAWVVGQVSDGDGVEVRP